MELGGLEEGRRDVAALLQASGYRTIHVGKGHFGPGRGSAEPKNLGFDVNVAGCSIRAPASYYGRRITATARRSRCNAVPHLEKYHGTETFLTEALTLEAKAELTGAVGDGKPFFLYLAHYAVHAPFNSDPRFAANYWASGKPRKPRHSPP